MIEKFYAIRIGEPRRHRPYLWCGEDGRAPRLFLTREEANIEHGGFDRDAYARVVRVNACFGRKGGGR